MRGAEATHPTEGHLAGDLNGLNSKPHRRRTQPEGARSISARPYFFQNRHFVWHTFTSYPISRGGANIMHLELVVIERSAQGDGIATNSGVKILESRLDMTKRARKCQIKKIEMSKWHHLTSSTTSRGNFHIFSPEFFFFRIAWTYEMALKPIPV